jgi:glycosyltransferase involved in cell wall biosynthesis
MLRTADIGIMPLFNGDWELGKCGYKIVQYMASGLPVVASPVGANLEIVDHGKSGFLASGDIEWIKYLTTLLVDRDLRARFGEAGERKARSTYDLRVQAEALVRVLSDAPSR